MITKYSHFNNQLNERIITNNDQLNHIRAYIINIFGQGCLIQMEFITWSNSIRMSFARDRVSMDLFSRKNLNILKNYLSKYLNKKLSYTCDPNAWRSVNLEFREVYEVKKGDDVLVSFYRGGRKFEGEGVVMMVGKGHIEIKFHKTLPELSDNFIKWGNWTKNTKTQEDRNRTLLLNPVNDQLEMSPSHEETNYEEWYED